MMRVAFYAPMKSPRSPVPSGDREMARSLMAAIAAPGVTVDLASELKIYDKRGDVAEQERLRREAGSEVARLVASLPAETRLWVTYHSYYKSPDLVGPAVCAARGIPYVQVESTRATSRLAGPWAMFAQAAHEASDAAAAIFYLTANDLITLERERHGDQALVHLPPFLPVETLPAPSRREGPILSAGMMRAGDKLRSYTLIAETLALLDGDWRLEIAGDGPARAEVEALMAPYGNRVRFLGQLDRKGLRAAYARAGLFLWPGVNEAFGMVYLEAQAAGLPVVAQDRPGVRDVLLSGLHPLPEDGPQALAVSLARLIRDPVLRATLGEEARRRVACDHLLTAARERFWAATRPLVEESA
ncbi:glycosyltransferase family 4 protein [Cribrihabitans sp. XS_ASV171]